VGCRRLLEVDRKDYAKMNVDKRGDIVTKCIDDKMKATR
jgi:hypothetical protein